MNQVCWSAGNSSGEMKQKIVEFSLGNWSSMNLKEILPEELQDDYWKSEAETVASDFRKVAQPKLVYRLFPQWTGTTDTLLLDGKRLHGGRRMSALLEKADFLAVVVATLGEGVMALYKQYDKEGDLIKAYLCDAFVNYQMDLMMKTWRESFVEMYGVGSTFPLSPGCCDWDLAEQVLLFSLLEPEAIGVRLSESSVMYPLKSLSAIVGFGKDLPFMKEECLYCGRKNCNYRRVK